MRINYKNFLVIVILLTIICMGMQGMNYDVAYAKKAATSGEYFGMHWKYDKMKKTLTITGKGKMHDYFGDEEYDECPWWDYSRKTEKIVIGNGITHIGGSAFEQFIVTCISIPDSVTSIGDSAFSGCNKLENITLPNGLIKISGAFDGTNLKKIKIPDSVNSMGRWMFSDCNNLSSVTLPKNIKKIPEGTFRNCPKLKHITIPDSVTTIGANAFESSGIISVAIPENVTTLKNDIFLNCKNLKAITIRSDKITKIGKNTWNGLDQDTVIFVRKNKLKAYRDMFYKAGLSKKVIIKQLW